MGGLHDHRHAIEQNDFMAPVKLIGFRDINARSMPNKHRRVCSVCSQWLLALLRSDGISTLTRAGHSGLLLTRDEPVASIIQEAMEGFASGRSPSGGS
jgi:hypothetical protein